MHKSKILLNIKKYTQNKTNKKKKSHISSLLMGILNKLIQAYWHQYWSCSSIWDLKGYNDP